MFDLKRRYSFICPYISFGNLCKFSKEFELSLSSYKLLICNMVLKFTAEILFSVGEMNLSLEIYCKILINYPGISYRILQTINTPRSSNTFYCKTKGYFMMVVKILCRNFLSSLRPNSISIS